MTHKMNHELRAELANAQLRVKDLEAEVADLRADLGQCSRELLACSTSLDESRRAHIELSERFAGPRCSCCGNLCIEACQENGLCPDCCEPAAPVDPYELCGVSPMHTTPMPAPEPGVELAEWNKLDVGDDTSDLPAPEPGVSYGDPSNVGDEDLAEEEPNLNTPEGDSDFEVIP